MAPYNQYLQKNPFADAPLSDLNEPLPQVTDSLKPLERKDSNMELEKGEVALSADGNLYRVRGKSHAQGGTPVNLPDGSFIYSNHTPLSIPKKEQELFRFKEGGTFRKTHNTPAKLVQRHVDIKHHNQMVAIQDSDNHDDISKTSAQLMLQKNYKRLGQVAFLQEEKKGFPQGLPGISQGTAPVSGKAEEQQSDMQEQYQQGGFTRLGRNNPWMNMDTPISAPVVSAAADCHPSDPDCHPSRRKLLTPTPIGEQTLPPVTVTDTHRRAPVTEITPIPRTPQMPPMDITGGPGINVNVPAPEEPVLPYEPNVPLTPSQLLTLGYDAYNAASIKKYYPKREQMSFTPLNLERVSAQPYLNQVDNAVTQAYNTNSVYDPIAARAQNSALFGKALEQKNQVLGNVDNQNRQIANQESQFNTQGVNATAAQNVQLDGKYYDQVQALNQNFDNEKRFAWNRVMDQYNQYRSQNDSLEMQLASQPTYGTIDVWKDPKTGKTSRTGVQGWTKAKQAAPLYDYNARKNSVYFTGAGMSADQLPEQTSGFSFQQIKDYADDLGLDARGKAYLVSNWLKQSNPYGRKTR